MVCEKPLARDTAEPETMRYAVMKAHLQAAVCVVYRCWPAVDLDHPPAPPAARSARQERTGRLSAAPIIINVAAVTIRWNYADIPSIYQLRRSKCRSSYWSTVVYG